MKKKFIGYGKVFAMKLNIVCIKFHENKQKLFLKKINI
jgi:hypothetical protein